MIAIHERDALREVLRQWVGKFPLKYIIARYLHFLCRRAELLLYIAILFTVRSLILRNGFSQISS